MAALAVPKSQDRAIAFGFPPSDRTRISANRLMAAMARSRVLKHATVLATSSPRTSRACSSGFRPILAHRPSIVSRIQFNSHHPRAYSSHSDQSVSPLARSVITATRAIRNVLIVSTSTLTLGLFVWAGSHAYLEQYKCPSPPGCSSTVRNCLHGAWVREEIAPDPDVAEVYLQKALELTRQELEDLYKKKYKDDHHQHDMTRFLEIEKDQALVEIQNRLARFYGRIGQHEQAATIWTRLWRMARKPNPRESLTTSSTGAFSLSSLFGTLTGSGERPLVTEQDGVQFAKRAADSWMHMAEYDLAEEALAWTLSHVAASNRSATTESSVNMEEIGLLSTLGALYVRQGKFEYALSLFVKALQAVQEHQRTAATQQAKKEEEALGWMQKAITMAKEKSGQHRDCDECAALGLSNLGLISEMEGKNDEALPLFREAVVYATKAKDYVGIDDYNGSIARLTATLTTPEDTTPSTPPSPA
ncbi:hypothetical protein KVV02_008325 [Mortierella alpina]|uniref:Uncharacterized protein n=1 Tax=Mortierella alpina TaxID=64518 RepID=A0A9P7ZXM3_MORAP|nr:hypothetical protein KVV02_008325 [Mortierella alpina]